MKQKETESVMTAMPTCFSFVSIIAMLKNRITEFSVILNNSFNFGLGKQNGQNNIAQIKYY